VIGVVAVAVVGGSHDDVDVDIGAWLASDVTTNVDGAAASVVTDAAASAITETEVLDDAPVDANANVVVAVVSTPLASTATTWAAGGAPQLASASPEAMASTINRRAAHVRIEAET
jgi:hypothetical protein